MAQLKQCPNGHYFDPSMYPSCPYCSGASVGIDRSAASDIVADYGIKTAYPGADGGAATSPVGGTPTVAPESVIYPSPYNGVPSGETVVPDRPLVEDTTVTRPVMRPGKKKHTVPVQDAAKAPAEDDEPELPEKVVTGWLVAVEGPYAGKSFELHHSYNYIGRDKGDIVLAKDEYVSGVKNAWVMYSEKNNRFMFGAGESSNVVYVNDDELPANSNVRLNPYDLIELGSSKFRFVPFCSEQFQW